MERQKIAAFIIAVSIVISMFTSSMTAFAAESSELSGSAEFKTSSAASLNFEYVVRDEGTVMLTEYIGGETAVSVPAKIDGHTVSAIGSLTFFDCSFLTAVTIPSTVEYIGSEAFMNCSQLKEIVLPDNVAEIGGEVIYAADALCVLRYSVGLGDSNTLAGKYVNAPQR